jgi:hypothetical protein
MNTTYTGTYHRCSCTDQTGHRLGRRCPKLSDRSHGSWYYATQLPTTGGRTARIRRGGYPNAQAARNARCTMLAMDTTGHTWTLERWLRSWLSTLPTQIRPATLAGYRCHVTNDLIPHLGGHTLTGPSTGLPGGTCRSPIPRPTGDTAASRPAPCKSCQHRRI